MAIVNTIFGAFVGVWLGHTFSEESSILNALVILIFLSVLGASLSKAFSDAPAERPLLRRMFFYLPPLLLIITTTLLIYIFEGISPHLFTIAEKLSFFLLIVLFWIVTFEISRFMR